MDGTVSAGVEFGSWDSTGGYDCAIIAVGANTGEKERRVDTKGSTGNVWPAPVTVAEETVVTAVPNSYGPTQVTAFAAEGTKRWQHSSGIERLPSMPIADGLVYVYNRYGVKALDLKSGETVWEALPRVRFDPAATPMVAVGTLFVAEEGEPGVTLIALNVETGEEE